MKIGPRSLSERSKFLAGKMGINPIPLGINKKLQSVYGPNYSISHSTGKIAYIKNGKVKVESFAKRNPLVFREWRRINPDLAKGFKITDMPIIKTAQNWLNSYYKKIGINSKVIGQDVKGNLLAKAVKPDVQSKKVKPRKEVEELKKIKPLRLTHMAAARNRRDKRRRRLAKRRSLHTRGPFDKR